MGMTEQEFHKILDELTNWIMGTSIHNVKEPSPRSKECHEMPIKGYPVVLSFKKDQYPCVWCNEPTKKMVVYKRDADSKIWHGKCLDCKRQETFENGKIVEKKPLF
jgi:hypothetical protein